MSVKALRNQLLAAIAMVLVAAIALGSSTFAWFAGNNIVTAETMKVQAVAEQGIEIKYVDQADAAYSSVNPSGENAVMLLYPTSTYSASTWAHANAKAATAFTAAAGAYEMLTGFVDGNAEQNIAGSTSVKQSAKQKYISGKQYYRVDKFNIRTVQGTTVEKKVVVKNVAVTGTPAALDKSLRVIVTNGDGSAYYAYNVGGGDTTRNVAVTVNESKNPATVAAVTYLGKDVASGLLCTCAAGSATAAGAAQDVYIYTYYEGEESEHFSNNLQGALAELTVTVTFEAVDTATAFTATTVNNAETNVANGTTPLNTNTKTTNTNP